MRFFYTDKSQNSKRYLFANVKRFWHLTFCHSGWVNSIKTNLKTCNLWTGLYVSYKSLSLFWLNLPHQNGKTFFTSNGKTFFTSNVKNFSHLQMAMFCYFDFCHCRRVWMSKLKFKSWPESNVAWGILMSRYSWVAGFFCSWVGDES